MPIQENNQTTSKQHAVPQNIMDVEFKIIGDLTLRQFAYILVFGGIAWGAATALTGIFKWPVTVTSALLGIGLAFFTIGDRGLDQWIVNFFKAMYSPTQRMWQKQPEVLSIFMRQNLAVVRQEMITLAPTSSRRKLEEYLENQDKPAVLDRLDIPENEFIRKVQDAYAHEPKVASSYAQRSGAMYSTVTPTTTATIVSEPITIAPSPAQPPLMEKPPIDGAKRPAVPDMPVEQKSGSSAQTSQLQQHSTSATVPQVPQTYQTPAIQPASVSTSPPAAQVPTQHKQQQETRTEPALTMPTRRGPYIPLSPITPDRHSGRRFTNLLPSHGEIVLPIRGEKVLRTSDSPDIERDMQEKSEQLKKLIEQIKADESFKKGARPTPAPPLQAKPTPTAAQPVTAPATQKPQVQMPQFAQPAQPNPLTPPAPAPEVSVKVEAEETVKKMQSENDRLNMEISKLKAELAQPQKSEEEKQRMTFLLQQLEKLKEKNSTDAEILQAKIKDLEQRLMEKGQAKAPTYMSAAAPVIPSAPTYSKIAPLSTKPNTISGIVKSAQGTALEGVILVIKNQKGEPVRALKTNTLGQFSIITPLSNGSYTVEVDKSNKTGLTFDIISIEISGNLIPPLEFVGK